MTISENYNPVMSTSLPTYIHVRGGSRHFHKGVGGRFFFQKKNGFQNNLFLENLKHSGT